MRTTRDILAEQFAQYVHERLQERPQGDINPWYVSHHIDYIRKIEDARGHGIIIRLDTGEVARFRVEIEEKTR